MNDIGMKLNPSKSTFCAILDLKLIPQQTALAEVKNPASRFALVCRSAFFYAGHHGPLAERDCDMERGKQTMKSNTPSTLTLDRPLQVLTPWQIQQIDEALAGLGPFAEVRLIKERGKLRFIKKVESESALGPPD